MGTTHTIVVDNWLQELLTEAIREDMAHRWNKKTKTASCHVDVEIDSVGGKIFAEIHQTHMHERVSVYHEYTLKEVLALLPS